MTHKNFLKTLLIGCTMALSTAASAGGLLQAALTKSASTATGTINATTGFQTTSSPLRYTYVQVNGTYVKLPVGTSISTATLVVGGVTRNYTIIKPTALTSAAPLLLMLHGNGSNPEQQANLSLIADYALTQRFWVVLPAAVNGVWGDDPTRDSPADVNFMSALIDEMVTQGADKTRVYASGFSNGAFMSERLACELSNKIAAFTIVSATLRTGLKSSCAPAIERSKVYVLGTADNVVSYNGMAGMLSASQTISFWMAKQGCASVVSSLLPVLVSDGTSIQLDQYASCTTGTELRLYTVNGGGHAWPGGTPSGLGATSQNMAVDGILWMMSSGARV